MIIRQKKPVSDKNNYNKEFLSMNIPDVSLDMHSVSSSVTAKRPARTRKAVLKVPLAHASTSASFGAHSLHDSVTPLRMGCAQEQQTEETTMDEVMRTEEQFFAALIKSNRAAHLYLLSGVKLQGWLVQETEFCILLNMNHPRATLGNIALIYKSAISSVVPFAVGEQARRGAKLAPDREEYAA
jgi:RNA chaperone Hfq